MTLIPLPCWVLQTPQNEMTYLSPGPVISGHPDMVQNSEMVPYTRLIWSKNAIAEIKTKQLKGTKFQRKKVFPYSGL